MDSQSKKSVAVPEIYCNNYGLCCSNKTSETSTSSYRTYVPQCRVDSSSKSTATTNVKLREDMIKALAWASYRTFKYQPSNPIHYLAHQLLRWRYGDISEYHPKIIKFRTKNSSAGQSVSSRTFSSEN